MGTPIQEPNQIDDSHITDANAHNIALIVYEKSSDGAGLKQLGLAKWKSFMNYNGYKADNVAKLSGFSKTEYDKNYEIDPPEKTLVSRINAIQTNTGVTDTIADPPATPLATRIGTLETTVGEHGSGSTAGTGLCKQVDDNSKDIEDLKDAIGGGGGTPGQSLYDRMETAEQNISDLDSVVNGNGTPENPGLKNVVGDSSYGLVKQVNTLETTVGDSSDGLVKDVSDLQTTVGNNSDGLVKQVNDIENTLGDSSDGLVKDVADLQETTTQLTGDVSTLKEEISAAYKIRGKVDQSLANQWSTNEKFETFKTGFVWDVDASGQSPQRDFITIKVPTGEDGETYKEITVNNGVNIVWIELKESDPNPDDYTYGYFDELTNTIVDKRVDELETKVDQLDKEVYGDTSLGTIGILGDISTLQNNTWTRSWTNDTSPWTSETEKPSGVFIITGRSVSNKLASAIITLNNGKVVGNAGIIQLGTELYTDLFEADATTKYITVNTEALTFNITKIGGKY